MRPREIFGTLADNNVPFDEELVIAPEDGEGGEYHIGWGFKAGHVGMLRQVKWFMKDVTDSSLYADQVVFQGSADGETWTDIFTVDENVHDGWNYYNWE